MPPRTILIIATATACRTVFQEQAARSSVEVLAATHNTSRFFRDQRANMLSVTVMGSSGVAMPQSQFRPQKKAEGVTTKPPRPRWNQPRPFSPIVSGLSGFRQRLAETDDGSTVTTSSPGLAISNDPIALPNAVLNYAVLHVASGEFIATAPKKRQAVQIAQAIAPLADWTQSVDALRAVSLLARRVRHIVWDARD